MGQVPTWYRVVRAAKYLGVAPWDLAERPVWWVNAAEDAQSAEAAAEKAREGKERRTAAPTRGRGR